MKYVLAGCNLPNLPDPGNVLAGGDPTWPRWSTGRWWPVPDPGEVLAVLLGPADQLALGLTLDVSDLAHMIAQARGAGHVAENKETMCAARVIANPGWLKFISENCQFGWSYLAQNALPIQKFSGL